MLRFLLNQKRVFVFVFLLGFASLGLSPKGRTEGAESNLVPCGRVPADVVLILDHTGSIAAENRELIRMAAQDLIEILLTENPDNRIALGRFGSIDCVDLSVDPTVDTYLASLGEIFHPLSGDTLSLTSSLSNALLYSSCGLTNLEDPLRDAEEALATGNNPNKMVVLLSDGQPNIALGGADPIDLALQAAEDLKNNEVRLFTIAFDASLASDEELRDLLAQIASQPSQDDPLGDVDDTEKQMENQDGDDFFIAPNGEDLAAVFSSIGEIILCEAEPKNQTETNSKELPGEASAESPPSSQPNPSHFPEDSILEGSGSMGCSLRKY